MRIITTASIIVMHGLIDVSEGELWWVMSEVKDVVGLAMEDRRPRILRA